MTTPCTDPASEIVTAYTTALGEVFDPLSDCPPDGGGSTEVRFFGGDAVPMAAWNAHNGGGSSCDEPFLWVRVIRRYRSAEFPDQTIGIDSCSLPRVIALEIGVGRCSTVELDPSWDEYAAEAEISLDDSWRIELALCRAAARVRTLGYPAGTGEVSPYGPEGGIVAWMGEAYVQF